MARSIARPGLLVLAAQLAAAGTAHAQDFRTAFSTTVVDDGPLEGEAEIAVSGETTIPVNVPYRSPVQFRMETYVYGPQTGTIEELRIELVGSELLYSRQNLVVGPNPPPPFGWRPFCRRLEGFVQKEVVLPPGSYELKISLRGRRVASAGRFAIEMQFADYGNSLYNPELEVPLPPILAPGQIATAVKAFSSSIWSEDQVIDFRSSNPEYISIDSGGGLLGRTFGRVAIFMDWQLVPGQSTVKTLEQSMWCGHWLGYSNSPDVVEVRQFPDPVVPGQPVTFQAISPWPGRFYEWYLDGSYVGEGELFTMTAPFTRGRQISVDVSGTGALGNFGYDGITFTAIYGSKEIRLLEGQPLYPIRVDPPEPVSKDAQARIGDCSVLAHNGENNVDRTDLVVPGRGVHFAFSRRYLSRIEYLSPLGHGWDANVFEKLVVDEATGDVRRVLLGRADTWRNLGAGRYEAPASFFGELRRAADGTFVLRDPDGSKTHFDDLGRLASQEDRHGNRLLYEHEGGKLVRVLDAYDRVITFGYAGERLTSVRDFAGREVLYGYEDDCLVSVRSPIVTGTPTADDFPVGRTERYAYTTGRAEAPLRHNLSAIFRPQEVKDGGVAYYQWTYFEDPADFRFDRVATQTLGGTNTSGVPAGGTWTFAYEPSRTTVTDRAGSVTQHEFNERGERIVSRQLTRGLRPSDPAAFETRSWFDEDGRLVKRVFPAGNELRLTYGAGPRAAQSNVVEARLVAGPRGGGADLVTRMTYEPLFQQLASITDPRGTAPYTAPLGSWSAERYTTRFFFDYQEGSGPVAEAVALGIDLSGVDRGLGDLNGDGRTDQVQGQVVRAQAPSVTLRPESLEADRLGTTSQAVVTETTWNDHGQPIAVVDPEGNVTELVYHPQSDPDGDGVVESSLPADASGYLAAVVRDSRTSPRRRTIAPPLRLETRLSYDRLGHMTRVQDPRGVVTRVDVNVLGEVLQVTRGDDVGVAIMSGQLVTGEAALRYRARFFHDFNGRVVRTEVENRDDAVPGVGPWIEREVEHDILD
jgi:hypothetical protein